MPLSGKKSNSYQKSYIVVDEVIDFDDDEKGA